MHGKVHCILPSRWSDTGTFGCGPGGGWRHITEPLPQQRTRMRVAKRRGQIIVLFLHCWSARRVFGGGLWAGVSPSAAAENRQ